MTLTEAEAKEMKRLADKAAENPENAIEGAEEKPKEETSSEEQPSTPSEGAPPEEKPEDQPSE